MTHSQTSGLTLGGREIGIAEPPFVIAEAGVNHDGETERAHRLIDVAADCGADAVKFQTFQPKALVSATAGAAPYQAKGGASPTQRELLRALTLPDGAWPELAAHARERRLLFLSTAFDHASLELVLSLGVEALKVPSGELDHLQLIRAMASHGLPLLISTGMGTLAEVEAAVAAAGAAPGLALLHCVTAYPAPVDESNLRALGTLGERFAVPVGWSDHTRGTVTAVAAVALGARLLEKHFTLDHGLPGPDHAASAEPDEMAAYVAAVHDAWRSLGNGAKEPAPSELENRRFARRSYHAARRLHTGDVLGEADVRLLRPADGLPPSAGVLGRKVAREVDAGQPLVAEDLESEPAR